MKKNASHLVDSLEALEKYVHYIPIDYRKINYNNIKKGIEDKILDIYFGKKYNNENIKSIIKNVSITEMVKKYLKIKIIDMVNRKK